MKKMLKNIIIFNIVSTEIDIVYRVDKYNIIFSSAISAKQSRGFRGSIGCIWWSTAARELLKGLLVQHLQFQGKLLVGSRFV